jgi:hypothetical protein
MQRYFLLLLLGIWSRLEGPGVEVPFSTCPPYVSQPPREMADTCRPERPRNRYSILGRPSGGAILQFCWEFAWKSFRKVKGAQLKRLLEISSSRILDRGVGGGRLERRKGSRRRGAFMICRVGWGVLRKHRSSDLEGTRIEGLYGAQPSPAAS